MKKDNALKQAARWVARMFGYKSETFFGHILWALFAGSITVILLVVAMAISDRAYEQYSIWRCGRQYERQQNDPTYLHEGYNNFYVSPYVIHHEGYLSYLYNTVEGRRTITGIQWICKSADDSLTVYSKDDKRGYFNMYTGKPVIPAQYQKAWVFSEGVAWVMDQGELHLIDQEGKDVLGRAFPYSESIDCYCFHQGICPMLEYNGRIGFINKKGEWVIEPFLSYVNHDNHGFWSGYDSEGRHGLLKDNGEVLLPFEFDYIYVHYREDYIYARRLNHVDQVYDCEGNLVNVFSFNNVTTMDYESEEFVYRKDLEEYIRKTETANCMRYTTSDYHYGLMDKNGNVITLPLYTDIDAIGKDCYLCESEAGTVILDGKGKEVGTKKIEN